MDKAKLIIFTVAIILLTGILIYFAINIKGKETIITKTDTVIVKQYETIYQDKNEVKLLWKKSGPVMITTQKEKDTIKRNVDNILSLTNDNDRLQIISKQDSTITRYDFGKISERGFQIIADSNNIIIKKQMLWLEKPEAFIRYEFRERKKFIGTRIGLNYDDNIKLTGAAMYEPAQKETKFELEFLYKIKF